MTGDAIAVDAATQSFGIRCAPLIGIGLMLVIVMAEVLRGSPGLVLAIAGHRRPGELERQKNEKKDRQPTTHGLQFSSYEIPCQELSLLSECF